MLRKITLCFAALLVASPALAQSVTISESASQALPLTPYVGEQTGITIESTSIGIENEPSIIDTLPRITPALAATLIADDITDIQNTSPLEEDVSIYVVEEGTVLPASSWSATDTEACKASGGIEVPLPGNRIACFKL